MNRVPRNEQVASLTDPLGHTTSIAYDDTAQTETVTDPLGHHTTTTLNNEGQAIQETDGLGHSAYLSYLYGQLMAIANPLGQVMSDYRDAIGQVLQITDPAGNTFKYTWTPLGQLASQTSPTGAVTTNAYDPVGNLTSLTDADQNTTTFAYDGNTNLTKKTDPLGKVYTYSYDGDGNLLSVIDANTTKNTFAYDQLNRLVTAQYAVSTGGSAQSRITATYDAADRLVQAVDSAAGTYKLRYDGLDDVLSQSSPQGTITHTYNSVGLPTSMTVPNQPKTTYTYDKNNHLTKIVQGSSTATIRYDADTRLTSLTLPDGITRTTTYDAASQPSSLIFTNASSQVGSMGYSYTPDGQISSESGSLARSNLPPAVTNNYNADNELTMSAGTAYTYDGNGNLTSNGTSTYTWNARGQLTTITGPTTAAFTYSPFDQRETTSIGGTTTSYLYDGTAPNSNAVQELSGTTPKANVLTVPGTNQPSQPALNTIPAVGAPGQILQLTTPSGEDSSFLTNPLGSTLALAGASGQITTNYTYTPSGTVTSSGTTSVNTFQFNGTENDGTGGYLMGARYYSPTMGTFISPDPIGLTTGTDLYQYAKDDPLNFSDPSGCGAHEHCVNTKTAEFAILLALAVVLILIFAGPWGWISLGTLVEIGGIALAVGALVGLSLFTLPGYCPD